MLETGKNHEGKENKMLKRNHFKTNNLCKMVVFKFFEKKKTRNYYFNFFTENVINLKF